VNIVHYYSPRHILKVLFSIAEYNKCSKKATLNIVSRENCCVWQFFDFLGRK